MTDFRQAFIQGQEAVDRAKIARKEILQTFARLFKDIADVTNGAIEMKFQTFPKGGAYGSAFLALTLATSKLIRDAEPIPSEEWIIARNTNGTDAKRVKLARWTQSDSGYPCNIRYSEVDDNIHNLASLETALANFLANAWVGEQIQRLSAPNSQGDTEPSEP
ncbi:hypothetical protein [Paraburkholderia sp. HP33-1]|uniref:hypothetical protein n=1 Tax=Paraburkholderia sp. HP33-1 TaxID=2883243 RepID=UPI001F3614B1|nr:hypothetical protein [Paraburkholderia sp. HP33-1]